MRHTHVSTGLATGVNTSSDHFCALVPWFSTLFLTRGPLVICLPALRAPLHSWRRRSLENHFSCDDAIIITALHHLFVLNCHFYSFFCVLAKFQKKSLSKDPMQYRRGPLGKHCCCHSPKETYSYYEQTSRKRGNKIRTHTSDLHSAVSSEERFHFCKQTMASSKPSTTTEGRNPELVVAAAALR